MKAEIGARGLGHVKDALGPSVHFTGMVTRKPLRSLLTAVGLFVGAGLLIGYFWVNAYTGPNGLKARQDIDVRIAQLNAELATLQAERSRWERRVSLLHAESLDPDMLDERARALLDYVDPNDLTLQIARP
jgi:cell division protein FtsB